jgi:hypothetical protein
MDFRDQFVKTALDETVRPYRPEKTLLARLRRIGVIAALALATCVGLVVVLNRSTPRPPPPPSSGKPIAVQLLPPTTGK